MEAVLRVELVLRAWPAREVWPVDSLQPEPLPGALAARPARAATAESSWSYQGPRIPWVRLFSGMALVVGVVCLGVFAVKRFGGGVAFARGRYMEVLETCAVGQKVQLMLVKVAGRVVLLAAAGETVSRLAELDEADLPELEAGAESASFEGFKSLLCRLAGARQ